MCSRIMSFLFILFSFLFQGFLFFLVLVLVKYFYFVHLKFILLSVLMHWKVVCWLWCWCWCVLVENDWKLFYLTILLDFYRTNHSVCNQISFVLDVLSDLFFFCRFQHSLTWFSSSNLALIIFKINNDRRPSSAMFTIFLYVFQCFFLCIQH